MHHDLIQYNISLNTDGNLKETFQRYIAYPSWIQIYNYNYIEKRFWIWEEFDRYTLGHIPEACDRLKFNRFGKPDQIISRGHGHGVAPRVERLVRSARGFPEGIVEAWGNLYTEFALAIAARQDGRTFPKGYLGLPLVTDGASGVRFIDACVRSDEQNGDWTQL